MTLTIHLISDSTGETLRSFSRASLAHFNMAEEPREKVWSLVRSQARLEAVLSEIANDPGVVLYTLADKELGDRVAEYCAQSNTPSLGVLDHSIAFFAHALGQPAERKATHGSYHHNEESLSRLAAMEFALTHDDGQAPQGYKNADVVVVGVSRTSKTPTCIYLANRGIRAANFPLVPGTPLPPELTELDDVLVIGLTLNARSLLDMRRTRLDQLGQGQGNAYVDHDNIRLEISEARRVYAKHGWHAIDVTRRSVEETAAMIIQQVELHKISSNENSGI